MIWKNVHKSVRIMDLKIQRCQKPLIKGKTAFVQATKDSPALTETEQDAGALLSNASFELNRLRKDLIKPGASYRYTHLCKPSVRTSKWLFGDDLHKAVKEMDEEQKAAGVMRNRPPYPLQGGKCTTHIDTQCLVEGENHTNRTSTKKLDGCSTEGIRHISLFYEEAATTHDPSEGDRTSVFFA